ncbi:hypothetical protein [Croceiramulus getboli]|nr:hypothetical protein P8624_09215 [Flavobacteriaceae bacterium YJPT1-3]
MIHTVFPSFDAVSKVESGQDFNWTDFMFANIEWIFALIGLAILLFFISSIGLLKRKNWARLTIIVLLIIANIYMIVTSIWNWLFFYDFDLSTFDENFAVFEIAVTVFTFIIVLAMTILFIWIIRRLMSASIKAEFVDG